MGEGVPQPTEKVGPTPACKEKWGRGPTSTQKSGVWGVPLPPRPGERGSNHAEGGGRPFRISDFYIPGGLWKSRKVAMEEQDISTGRAKPGHVARQLEEQNYRNVRAEKWVSIPPKGYNVAMKLTETESYQGANYNVRSERWI